MHGQWWLKWWRRWVGVSLTGRLKFKLYVRHQTPGQPSCQCWARLLTLSSIGGICNKKNFPLCCYVCVFIILKDQRNPATYATNTHTYKFTASFLGHLIATLRNGAVLQKSALLSPAKELSLQRINMMKSVTDYFKIRQCWPEYVFQCSNS